MVVRIHSSHMVVTTLPFPCGSLDWTASWKTSSIRLGVIMCSVVGHQPEMSE